MESQEKARGLTKAEKDILTELLKKAGLDGSGAPAVQQGEEYVALTNLSVPRRASQGLNDDKQCDLVRRGETIRLTDEQAEALLRYGPGTGRKVAVIRRKSEMDGDHVPFAHPSLLSGPMFAPPQPAPGTDGPRPDPAGSTRIVEQQPIVPESQPVTVAAGGTPTIADAIDIPPGGAVNLGDAGAGADMDVVEAVKAQAGLTSSRRSNRG